MIIKTQADKKRAESILEMVKSREDSLHLLDIKKFSTIVSETYYEIIKELSFALILLDGFRSVGENAHKDLISFLEKYNSFSELEISLLHDLRVRRNKSLYEGRPFEISFIEFNEKKLLQIIKKLKYLINLKLK